jgi:hypothetical protein
MQNTSSADALQQLLPGAAALTCPARSSCARLLLLRKDIHPLLLLDRALQPADVAVTLLA